MMFDGIETFYSVCSAQLHIPTHKENPSTAAQNIPISLGLLLCNLCRAAIAEHENAAMKREGRGGDGKGKANTPAPAMKAVALLQQAHDVNRNQKQCRHLDSRWAWGGTIGGAQYACLSSWLSLEKVVTWHDAFKSCISASESNAAVRKSICGFNCQA